MSASKYAYGVARIRAKRAFMLKLEDYEAMLRAPTFYQAMAHLQSVSDIARGIPQTNDPQELERHLFNRFAEILHSIARTVSGDARAFLEIAFSKYEYETLKAILKAKFLGILEDEISAMAPPMGRYSGSLYTSLISARGIEQAIDLIPDTELKTIIREALKQAEDLKSPIPIEAAIDRWLYAQLWRLARRLQKDDYKWATHLLGVEVDIKNILVLVRGKELNLQPAALDKMWLPITYKLQVDLRSLASQPLAAILQALASTYYGKAVSPLAKGSKEVERNLQLLWLKENEAVFLHYPFTLGSIYAYANLKYFELKDIRTILLSKLAGIPAEKVIPLIVRFAEKLSL